MTEQQKTGPQVASIINTLLLTVLAMVLPVIQWSVFGWFHVLLPLLSFYVLGKFGTYTGKKILFIAVAIGLIVFAFYENYELFAFSFAMILTGFVLHVSAEKGDSPAVSGLKGFLTLAGCWVFIFIITSIGAETSSYRQLIDTLDSGISEALKYYRESSDISAEALILLEGTLFQMKTVIPVIMPSILGSMILFAVWLTMVLGNRLLKNIRGPYSWGHYRYWQLPEKLIWLGILFGMLAILPVPIFKSPGINGLILLSVVYTFQGMAITVFFMNKWHIPLLLRSFLYAMIILQSFGTIVLLVCGVADIWFDFRKLKKTIPNTNE